MNLYTLAENLGMTVTRLVREMTVREYFGWMRFQRQRDAREALASQTRDSDPTGGVDPVLQVFGHLPGGR